MNETRQVGKAWPAALCAAVLVCALASPASAQAERVVVVPSATCGGQDAAAGLILELSRRLPAGEIALADPAAPFERDGWVVYWQVQPDGRCDLAIARIDIAMGLHGVGVDAGSIREAGSQLAWLLERGGELFGADDEREDHADGNGGIGSRRTVSGDWRLFVARARQRHERMEARERAAEAAAAAEGAAERVREAERHGAAERPLAAQLEGSADEDDPLEVRPFYGLGLGNEVTWALEGAGYLPTLWLGLVELDRLEVAWTIGWLATPIESPHRSEDGGGATPTVRYVELIGAFDLELARFNRVGFAFNTAVGAGRVRLEDVGGLDEPGNDETGWLGVGEVGFQMRLDWDGPRTGLFVGYRLSGERMFSDGASYAMRGPILRLVLDWVRP